jgi:alkanesulfonate monooxygenase SsuD/methylene tetrahydromethanopterin reductase-like flavin-dependent oxidoreductase (luciferase family)
MTSPPDFQHLAFFTRLLDTAPAAERYRLAAEQSAHAEYLGFDAAWVAQHHFDEHEGGLPSPFVFLGHLAARTARIRLGTGIVTLPLELPVRVAEDAIVLDLLSAGRLELGVGNGGNPTTFAGFELDDAHCNELFVRSLTRLRDALAGKPIPGGDTLYPSQSTVTDRICQATFSVSGGARAGLAGDGLMLSRTQPRPPRKLPGHAGRIAGTDHRCISCGAAAGTRTAHRRLAQRVCRRTPRRCPAARRHRSARRSPAFPRPRSSPIRRPTLRSYQSI